MENSTEGKPILNIVKKYKSIINRHKIFALFFVILTVILWWPTEAVIYNYIDEFLTLFCIFILLFNLWNIRAAEFIAIICCIGSLLFFGLISTVIAHLNQPVFAVLLDAFSLLKYPVTYLTFKYCFANETKIYMLRYLGYVAILYILAAFMFGIINLITDIGMTYDVRYGIRSFKFVHGNPAVVGIIAMLCMLVIGFNKSASKISIFYNILGASVVVLTLRAACLAAIGCYFVCKYIFKGKLKLKTLIILCAVALVLAYPQIEKYIFSESIRSILIRGGITVFNKYPFGAGFASYGSDMAYRYYSPLYYELGFDKIAGISITDGSIINDNFWPMILGQFGLLGIVLYLSVLAIQFYCLMTLKIDTNLRCLLLMIFVYLAASSIGAAIYTHEICVGSITIFALCESCKVKNCK